MSDMNHKVVQLVLVCVLWIYSCESVNIRDGNHVKNDSAKEKSFATIGYTDKSVRAFSESFYREQKSPASLDTFDYRDFVKLPSDRREIIHGGSVNGAKNLLYLWRRRGDDGWKVQLQKPRQLQLQKPRKVKLQKPKKLQLQKPRKVQLQKPRTDVTGAHTSRLAVYTSKDYAETPQRSIPTRQPDKSLVHRVRTDSTLLLRVKDSSRDVSGILNPRSKSGIGYYKSTGLQKSVRHRDDYTPRTDTRDDLNVLLLPRQSRNSETNGLSAWSKVEGRLSRVRRDAPSADHDNQNPWPDQSGGTEMKFMSPPYLKGAIYSKNIAPEIMKDPSDSVPSETADTTSVPSKTPATTSDPSKTLDTTSDPSKTLESTSVPSEMADTTSVPSKTLDTTSVPSKTLDTTSVPSKTLDTTSVPSETADTTSVPSEMADTTSVPSEMADTTSVPSKTLDTTSVPSKILDTTSVPSKTLDTTSVPSETADTTSVPSEMADTTSVPSETADTTSVPSDTRSPTSVVSSTEAAVLSSTTGIFTDTSKSTQGVPLPSSRSTPADAVASSVASKTRRQVHNESKSVLSVHPSSPKPSTMDIKTSSVTSTEVASETSSGESTVAVSLPPTPESVPEAIMDTTREATTSAEPMTRSSPVPSVVISPSGSVPTESHHVPASEPSSMPTIETYPASLTKTSHGPAMKAFPSTKTSPAPITTHGPTRTSPKQTTKVNHISMTTTPAPTTKTTTTVPTTRTTTTASTAKPTTAPTTTTPATTAKTTPAQMTKSSQFPTIKTTPVPTTTTTPATTAKTYQSPAVMLDHKSTTKTSPQQTTASTIPTVETSSAPSKITLSIATTKVTTTGTAKQSPAQTTQSFHSPTQSSHAPTQSSHAPTTKTSFPPTVKASRKPIPESSAEPTPEVSHKAHHQSSPDTSRSEAPTKMSLKAFRTTLPASFQAMADETLQDVITNITDQNATQAANPSTLAPMSTTLKSSTRLTSTATSAEPSTSEPTREHISTSKSTPSSSEPTKEPSDPEPEVHPEPKPEDDGSTPGSIAEPGPDWVVAKKKWNIAWEIHLYMLGGVFALIAGYTLLSVVKLYQVNRLLSKKYFVTLNLLVFVLCVLRAVFLLVDGYNANGTFPVVVHYLIYSTAFPCLTSAFSILLYSLLQATQMKLVPPRVQKIHVLVTFIFFHFALQITTDVLVGTYAGVSIMLFVCQLVFIAWGLFLFCGYAYIFRRLYTSAVKRQKNYQYMLSGKTYSNNAESHKQKFTLSLAVKVTFLAAIFGLVTIALEIYSIFGVYGVFQDKKPEPWPWWVYHTALRLVECLMCIIMAYVASQPFRCRDVKTCGFFCAPCTEMFKCASKEDSGDSLGWSEYDRLYLTTNSSKRSNGHFNSKKKKIYLNEGTDIVPIVIQSAAPPESRPLSMLIIEDGYVRFQAETDINKLVDNYARAQGDTEMATFKKGFDGIVNGAYIRSMEDTVRFQDDAASSDGYARKSRKSSLASSGFFRPPSSLSLADSMESEIDKAFQSMHQEQCNTRASTRSLPSRGGVSLDDNFQGPAIEEYLEQQARHQPSVQRSRSSLGDLNTRRPDTWRQKLFRSRSDSSGGVRTKDVDSLQYLSLLDLERQQDAKSTRGSADSCGSRDGVSSDDSYVDNRPSSSNLTNNCDVKKRLLCKKVCEPEEIDV